MAVIIVEPGPVIHEVCDAYGRAVVGHDKGYTQTLCGITGKLLQYAGGCKKITCPECIKELKKYPWLVDVLDSEY